MREENAIEVRDITKSFKVYMDRSNNVKDFLIHKNRRRNEVREVLKGISFDVKKGEAVGLIGRNGCGKSTTLKLLTRIMYPDSGSIEMRGRVTSLIELGAGFHPDMSGRENIYINASIFGLSKSEIDARVQDIIDFSELADYIDNPVRTYSSGMYMRLAFAVAINVDADILLIDEILAVGDIAFQTKCYQRLAEMRKQGITIVLVSHALGQVENICDTSIWIENGKIRMKGKPKEVHSYYVDAMSDGSEGSAKVEEDKSKAALERRVCMQGDYVERLRTDLYKALEYVEKEGATEGVEDALTQYRMEKADITDEEITKVFESLNPDMSKKYLYYGCVGHTDMIGKLRRRGYQVYGYESYALNIETPYVFCGKNMIRDMRFDEVFCVRYLELAVDPDKAVKEMEELKKSGPLGTKENLLNRMFLRNEEEPVEGDICLVPEKSFIHGPYCTLYDGKFSLHYSFENRSDKPELTYHFLITANNGDDLLAEIYTEKPEGEVVFDTDKISRSVEVLIKNEEEKEFLIKELYWEIL